MFTRDPLERLVSAYRDKLLHSEPYYSITVANEMKAMCRKNKNLTEKYGSEKRTNDDITLEYLRKLSSEQIEKIKKLYQMDVALFNYPYGLKMNLYETDAV
ncbi:aldo/keto reductase diketogulonate reductase [Platysternon megacephalum]|uniref:Carbohydrate sulfotransferase n=1 Tax=Platysternon megacephalum TaxID=55544 RepID=A0A4D9DCW2_9SAUR|nr:aldo/keto reductase diketogulonate reductase [Platysternon megacephalum]